MTENRTVKFIVNAAVIAALYAVLTLLLAPVSFGVVQVRISEVLCTLSLFTPAAVPGLTIGCFIANTIGGNGIIDAVLGSLATLIGSFGMYKLRHRPKLAPLVNVLSNGIIVGLMLCYVYGAELSFGPANKNLVPLFCVLLVSVEEIIPLYVLGVPLAAVIRKRGIEL